MFDVDPNWLIEPTIANAIIPRFSGARHEILGPQNSGRLNTKNDPSVTWLNNIRLTKLASGLAALLLVVCGVSIAASLTAVSGSNRVKATWVDFDQQTARKSELLGELRDAIGYGGMIHHFKN